jgi:glutamine synthetase
MFDFDEDGLPEWKLTGKEILKGESDGSSYPNGGLRSVHTAGGYLTIDPTSPIFLRGDTIFIPAAFVSWIGHALDQKTSLLRASDALSREGVRFMKLLGYPVKSLTMMVGFEQVSRILLRLHKPHL